MSNGEWETVSNPDNFVHWNEPGTVLEGIWLSTCKGLKGDNGIIETADGQQKQFGLLTVLKDLTKFPTGTKVRVEYMGIALSKAGREFKSFKIERYQEGE